MRHYLYSLLAILFIATASFFAQPAKALADCYSGCTNCGFCNNNSNNNDWGNNNGQDWGNNNNGWRWRNNDNWRRHSDNGWRNNNNGNDWGNNCVNNNCGFPPGNGWNSNNGSNNGQQPVFRYRDNNQRVVIMPRRNTQGFIKIRPNGTVIYKYRQQNNRWQNRQHRRWRQW